MKKERYRHMYITLALITFLVCVVFLSGCNAQKDILGSDDPGTPKKTATEGRTDLTDTS